MSRPGPSAVIDALVDPGSFRSWRYPVGASTQESDGSVVIGEATVSGHRLALILSDFGVLAGSVGTSAAECVVAALRSASAEGLPVFASPSSGGTRIQEGTEAFARMIDIAAAAGDHRRAGNPLVVWLRHPTTGGVMATWGSLGHVTFGEPGALTGFLGPRLFEPLTGSPMPPGVQTSENLARVGVIDAVLPISDLRENIATILEVVTGGDAQDRIKGREVDGSVVAEMRGEPTTRLARDASVGRSAWEAVVASRNPARPGLAELVSTFDHVTALSGTGEGERCDAVRIFLARVGAHNCVVIGQDRSEQLAGTQINPAGLRTARRGIGLATELRLPLVSVVDTTGGELSVASEEGAIAGEIARCLADQAGFDGPSVSVVLGMGCGGAALAMVPADEVLVAELGWIAPLPLEGASLIKYRTVDEAEPLATTMGVDSWTMLENGVVDDVVRECPDAAVEPAQFAARVRDRLAASLDRSTAMDRVSRRRRRAERYGARLAADTS